MKKIVLEGHRRENLGENTSKKLRKNAYVPGVLYGGAKNFHFAVGMGQLKTLVYTPDAYFIDLKVDGKVHSCILQDLQVHPVSEMILHMDLLEINAKKTIKMEIPVKLKGNAPGVLAGGLIVKKLRKLTIKALPIDMPSHIDVVIDQLELGAILKVNKAPKGAYEIVNAPQAPIVTIEIPRALRSEQGAEGKDKKEDGSEA